MSFDVNPKFGEDQAFSEGARRVMDLLWETTGGDVTAFPKSYLETLRHDFSDGKVSMLELIDRVDLGPNATYDDYCEVVDALLSVDHYEWPDPDSVIEVPHGNLTYEIDTTSDYSEFFDFADEVIAEGIEVDSPGKKVTEGVMKEEQTSGDPLSEKMELFFKKVISSVYLDGVTDVTDEQGDPPNSSNGYLMSPDGKQFSGIFYDSQNSVNQKYPFVISESDEGVWQIKY